MSSRWMPALQRWRENYYFSLLLSSTAKPFYTLGRIVIRQIEMKIKRNGTMIRLPNGAMMRIARDAGVGLSSGLFWNGLESHEPESVRAVTYLFERSAVFVDVGANYGFYSILSGLWNPSLRVIAFEPLRPIFEGLTTNVQLNHLHRRVRCENMALSNQSGTATLYLPPAVGRDLESTGTLSVNSWQVRQKAEPVQVETIRFDDYEATHPMQVDLVKIDVEDFEADVLLGMERVIRRDQPFIVCEILPRNREHKNERTRQAIEKLNYAAYWITPAGLVRVTRFDFERTLTNFLLSPVSTEAEVLSNPDPLWQRRSALRADMQRAG